MRFLCAHLAHTLKRSPVKLNRRGAYLCAHHLYVVPANASAPSSAERFHQGFLRGKSGRVTFQPRRTAFAVVYLGLREDTSAESLSAPRKDSFDARYLNYVDADRYYHRRAKGSSVAIDNLQIISRSVKPPLRAGHR